MVFGELATVMKKQQFFVGQSGRSSQKEETHRSVQKNIEVRLNKSDVRVSGGAGRHQTHHQPRS